MYYIYTYAHALSTYMYVCTHMRVCVYMCTCMWTQTCMHTCVHTYMHIHVYTFIIVHICTYTCLNVCMHAYIHAVYMHSYTIQTYAHTCIIHACTHTLTHMYTHIHTYMWTICTCAYIYTWWIIFSFALLTPGPVYTPLGWWCPHVNTDMHSLLHIYVHACTCINVYAHAYIHARVDRCIYNTYMYVCIDAHTHVYTHTCEHMCTHACMHTYMVDYFLFCSSNSWTHVYPLGWWSLLSFFQAWTFSLSIISPWSRVSLGPTSGL